MQLSQKPPWSKGQLKRLGAAISAGVETPEGCPPYGDVVNWYAELCDAVATEISEHDWTSNIGEFDVNSRAKTIDTLRQKLLRSPTLKLDQVQDLAGVRVEVNGTITDQTKFSEELVSHFDSAEKSDIRDMRDEPHSGYRAVHVWFTFPAGRVEVQIRTIHQSAWANVYERLGDWLGRGIRYGDYGEGMTRQLVDMMHNASDALAIAEKEDAEFASLSIEINEIETKNAEIKSHTQAELSQSGIPDEPSELDVEVRQLRRRFTEASDATSAKLNDFFELMDRLRRMLDEGTSPGRRPDQ